MSAPQAQREGYSFLLMSIGVGIVGGLLVFGIGMPVIGLFKITEATQHIARTMMEASAIMVFFQATQSTLSKGILRGGGDTRFLMFADVAFQILVSIPLGYVVAVVWQASVFWVLLALRIDFLIKTVWLTQRLQSGKWIHQTRKMA